MGQLGTNIGKTFLLPETDFGLGALGGSQAQASLSAASPGEMPEFQDPVQAISGVTQDYYQKYAILQGFVNTMQRDYGIDVTRPDFSRRESIDAHDLYLQAVSDIQAQGNKLKNQQKFLEQYQAQALTAQGANLRLTQDPTTQDFSFDSFVNLATSDFVKEANKMAKTVNTQQERDVLNQAIGQKAGYLVTELNNLINSGAPQTQILEKINEIASIRQATYDPTQDRDRYKRGGSSDVPDPKHRMKLISATLSGQTDWLDLIPEVTAHKFIETSNRTGYQLLKADGSEFDFIHTKRIKDGSRVLTNQGAGKLNLYANKVFGETITPEEFQRLETYDKYVVPHNLPRESEVDPSTWEKRFINALKSPINLSPDEIKKTVKESGASEAAVVYKKLLKEEPASKAMAALQQAIDGGEQLVLPNSILRTGKDLLITNIDQNTSLNYGGAFSTFVNLFTGSDNLVYPNLKISYIDSKDVKRTYEINARTEKGAEDLEKFINANLEQIDMSAFKETAEEALINPDKSKIDFDDDI